MLPDGQAVVADFGIARAAQAANAEPLTSSGMVVGTPQYMSPEQSGGAAVDGRSDQYSLACTLYEMLIGAAAVHRALTSRPSSPGTPLEPVPSLRIVAQTVPRVGGGSDHARHGEGARRSLRLDAAISWMRWRRRPAPSPHIAAATQPRRGAASA